MVLLIQLHWIAVCGQLVTITVVHLAIEIGVPVPALLIARRFSSPSTWRASRN